MSNGRSFGRRGSRNMRMNIRLRSRSWRKSVFWILRDREKMILYGCFGIEKETGLRHDEMNNC